MASTASVARPYAQALFEFARDNNLLDEWSGALNFLASVAADADFVRVLSDPRVDRDRVEQLLNELAAERLPEGGQNLIKLLTGNDRLDVLPDIAGQYQVLLADARSAVTAQVETARSLTEEQRQRLIAALEKRLGRSVSLDETVNDQLVGGAVVRAGDLVIDGSVNGRIEKLGASLAR